jgi:hypothetical protein
MIAAMIASVLLVAATLVIHYEALRLASDLVTSLTWIPPRARIVFVVFAAFAAHTIEVWLYALAYYAFTDLLGLGHFNHENAGFEEFVYFSAVVYTSLGFGDLLPIGNLRLIAGVEALVGLVMIGWSSAFTYLAMEKLWPLHVRRRRGD